MEKYLYCYCNYYNDVDLASCAQYLCDDVQYFTPSFCPKLLPRWLLNPEKGTFFAIVAIMVVVLVWIFVESSFIMMGNFLRNIFSKMAPEMAERIDFRAVWVILTEHNSVTNECLL